MRVRSAFGGSLHTDGADEKGGRVAAGQTCLPLAPREPGFLSTQMFAARTTRFLNGILEFCNTTVRGWHLNTPY